MGHSYIRNISIIAHVDHGKSTLADRLLELTGAVPQRQMRDQVLDMMDIERERGITIKMQPVRMQWKGYQINLIDTPGHIDFTYEVTRSLAAVEGALLVVDATQGIQAQTLTNLNLAREQHLHIIPIINKIDLPGADIKRSVHELSSILSCPSDDILLISAKTGKNVASILSAIIDRVPAPEPSSSLNAFRALIFDALYNEFQGVIAYIRVFSGIVTTGDRITFLRTKVETDVLEVGYLNPRRHADDKLNSGEIGYVVTKIKTIDNVRVGDTMCRVNNMFHVAPLPGYSETQPMVYADIFPIEGESYEKLQLAVNRLKLNDASVSFEPYYSDTLGYGLHCGFLGLLHLEIFNERLVREFDVHIQTTIPTVSYRVVRKSGMSFFLQSPAQLPPETTIERIEQPIASITIITPHRYMSKILDYVHLCKGLVLGTQYLDPQRIIIQCSIPLSKIITDFYDTIKNLSSGYASYSYYVSAYEPCSLVKLEVLVAEKKVPGLTMLVQQEEAQAIARALVTKLKKIIPPAQFVIKLQVSTAGKIIAAERISALRKNVTAKLYGGDVTRKKKLLEKQKRGKKKLMHYGQVHIPRETYLKLLRTH